MFKSFISKIEKLKPIIEKVLPWFFLVYFILIFAPYISTKVSFLNDFFINGTTKLIYRGFTCILFGIVCLILWAIYKPKIKYWSIIGATLLFVIYLISVIISPSSIAFVTTSLTSKVTLATLEIGNYSYIVYTFSFLADLIFFVLFINFIPCSIKTVKDLYPTLFFVIGFMLLSCLFSFITERNLILEMLKGGNEYVTSINSFFHSKNEFGLYLFIGSFACSFIFFSSKRGWLKIVSLPHLIFALMSIIISCKSAFVANLVLLICCIVYILFVTLEHKPKIATCVIIVASIFAVFFILFMTVPIFHSGSFNKLYKSISGFFEKLFGGLGQRMGWWSLSSRIAKGPFIIFGANDSFGAYSLDIFLKIENNAHFTDFHSGYVSWYVSHGILGSVIYFGFFIYLFILIGKLIVKDKKNGFLLLFLLISCLIFIVPESFTLFVSISSYAFLINLILIGYLFSLLEKYYPEGIWKKQKDMTEIAL